MRVRAESQRFPSDLCIKVLRQPALLARPWKQLPRSGIHRGCTFGESLEWDSAVTKHPDVIPSKNIYCILHLV